MKINELEQHILLKFPDDIISINIQNLNEIYIDVNSYNAEKIAYYVYDELHYPLVDMIANDVRSITGNFDIYYVFAYRHESILIIIKASIDGHKSEFNSIATKIFSADLYEREIYDLFGLLPIGHPDLRPLVFHSNWPDGLYPLRKDFNLNYKPPFVKKEIKFTKVEGEGVFEISVGPVHAGVIEPGHFRFSVAGEPIINLEAMLYFVHKGIEKMSEESSIERCLYIAERISGDESFTNSLAYCQAIEKIAEMEVPLRAQYTRVIFAEIERLKSHLGDLSGICLDVAYGFASAQFNMLRAWTYLIADELSGTRFLRSINKLGGVRKDFILGKEKSIIDQLIRIKNELEDTINIIKGNSLFIDRVENTGILENSIAIDLNVVGPAARATGIRYDVRKDYPYEAYKLLKFNVPDHYNGDVNCRMNVKIEECFESIKIIIRCIEGMPVSSIICDPIINVKPYKAAFGLTEAPRGENIHWVMTGENNTVFRYKVRMPSFCNWPAVCHAVKGNIVPDFPLINKSFNLSYAGNDL